MLRNSKGKRRELVEMELPEEPSPGGSLRNFLIEENISEDSLKMPEVRVFRGSLYFYAHRIFLPQVNIWITENKSKRE